MLRKNEYKDELSYVIENGLHFKLITKLGERGGDN